MLKKLKELLAEQTELRRKNRLLEVWIIKHMRKVRCLVNFIYIKFNFYFALQSIASFICFFIVLIDCN